MTSTLASAGTEVALAPGAAVPEAGEVLIGKYRVERTIGAGGMATVLAATHLKLDERVAIKLPRPDLVASPTAVERFLQEARVSSRLRGEHVVRVFDVGTLDNGSPYIVMEYLAGADLRTLLARRGPFPFAVAVDYVLQACEAVAEAHALGIVHRDLKPANLFLTRRVDGSACIKVLDFGISKMLDASRFTSNLDETQPSTGRFRAVEEARAPLYVQDASITKTRTVMGSPRYMAPEQVRSARDVDQRTDIWALGILLYELMEARPPFMDDDLDALRSAIAERAPPPLAASKAPEKLESIVRKCLEKEAANRFVDVHAFAQALAPFGSQNAVAVGARIGRVLRGSDVADAENVHGSTGDLLVSVTPESKETRPGFSATARTTGALILVAAVGAIVGVGLARDRRGQTQAAQVTSNAALSTPVTPSIPPSIPPMQVVPPRVAPEASAIPEARPASPAMADVAPSSRPQAVTHAPKPRPSPRVKPPPEAKAAPEPPRAADPFSDPE